jgi:D-lactate dehydrogenase
MRDQFGRVTPELLDRLPGLKLIVTRSVGYDHIDLAAAERCGIPVCNVPDYGAHMIAERAFGLLLAVARNIVQGHNRYLQQQLLSDQGLQGTSCTARPSAWSARAASDCTPFAWPRVLA